MMRLAVHWLLATMVLMSGPVIGQTAEVQSQAACSGPGTYAPEQAERWTAGSTTAMGITGDIVVSKTQIQFEKKSNGVAAPHRNINKTDKREGGRSLRVRCVTLYAIETPPADYIAAGSSICGPDMPTGKPPELPLYLALGLEEDGKSLGIAAYGVGSGPILLSSAKGELCGTFGYFRNE